MPVGISASLKGNLLWISHLETIEELRQALIAFSETYKTTWLIERHEYLTPKRFPGQQLQPLANVVEGSIQRPRHRGRYGGITPPAERT